MKIEEKNLCKTLLTSYGHFETICDAIDKTILNCGIHSCNTSCDTIYIANKMIDLMDRKKYLINLKVIINSALNKVKNQYAKPLMLKFVDQVDSNLASQILDISSRTYFRQINRGLELFWEAICSLKYNFAKLIELVEDENWIFEIYKAYSKKNLKENELKNLSFLNFALKSIKNKRVNAVQ